MVIILQIFFAACSNELEYLNILFKHSLPSKTFRVYVVSETDTTFTTSRFISPSLTKASHSPILTLMLIVNKMRLEVFEIGEYHLGNIIGFSPVLAGVYLVT